MNSLVNVILTSVAVSALAAMGCASVEVKSSQRAVDNLPKPSIILVYDFAVDPTDLEGSYRSSEPATADEVALGRSTAVSLSEQLVAKLAEKGIAAERASDSSQTPLHAVLVKGQFLDVDKGSRFKRVVIGFGAGSSKLEARVQAYQVLPGGTRRIAQAEAEATGSKMPGMALPVGAGAAAGRAAISIGVSGGMNIAKEARGGMHADAGRMAEQIADRILAYYLRQGWL